MKGFTTTALARPLRPFGRFFAVKTYLWQAALAASVLGLAERAQAGSVILTNPQQFQDNFQFNMPNAPNAWGNLVQAANGDLYIAGFAVNGVMRYHQGTLSTLSFGSYSGMGLALSGNTLYVGERGAVFGGASTIYQLDISQSNPTPVLDFSFPIANHTSAVPMALALAPNTFGTYGGQMIIGTDQGIWAVNLTTHAYAQILGSGIYSALAFTAAGTLLATDYVNGNIVQVNPNQSTSLFATVGGNPDGIAIDPTSGNIFVANSGAQLIQQISADGSTVSTFGTHALFDPGSYPSPLAFSTDGSALYYVTREAGTGTTISYIVDPVPSPEPASLLSLGLGALGLAGYSWRRRRRADLAAR